MKEQVDDQMTEDPVAPVRGASYYAPKFGMFVYVTRIAKAGDWADIRVSDNAAVTWRKRQPLIDGVFPFTVYRVAAGAP